MHVILSKDYPKFNGANIQFTFDPSHLPWNIDKEIKAPFQDMTISQVDADDLDDALPAATFFEGRPKLFKTYRVQIPGAFYEHVNEDMDTIAVITCEQDQIVMRSDLLGPDTHSRLVEVFVAVYSALTNAMNEQFLGAHADRERRLLKLERAA